ncbi:ABC transporter substrate-binding protein [Bacillus sp. J14TS2]|uniref:ABC transporter substrate-binding protein n=1 Tax=Bacillus sp. J14TS2 TaxID=2807188 RepID=UPI001B2233DE|nr:ABC transporter substrate-binding protein [Bacillus sp. J14TS2]GIN69773.1 ABC transporter substrate-binding protein [Bacillus sp. J14TS2]
MKTFKRPFAKLLLLILVLGTILAGCAGQTGSKKTNEGDNSDSSRKDKVVIDFWTFWGSETRRPIVEKIIDDFNASHDDIEVKHTYFPFGDIWTKSLASIAAGNPPDVIINDINTVSQRAEKKQNTNLSEFIEKEDGFEDQFFENTWTPMLYEGDPYAIPFDTDTYMLFYNKEIFKEVGLDPEKPPTTWKELEEYAEKIDKKNGNKYERIGFLPRHGAGADIYMLNTDGQSYWDYENNKPVINSSSNVEALQWVKDFESRYGKKVINSFSAEFGSETADPFIAGKIGMYISPGTFYTQIRDYSDDMEFGVAPLPNREGHSGGNTTWGGGFVAEIPYGAKNPEASWEFLKYLAGKDAQEYWAVENFTNVPNIEASEAAAESEELSELGRSVYQATVDNLDNTVRTPTPLEAPDYLSVINPEIEKALLGEQSVEDALDKAQKSVEKLVEGSK